MAMKLIKKTAEYKIFMRGDDRYAVQDGSGKPVNGEEKVRILVEEELIKVTVPAPKEEAAPEVEEAASDEAPEAAAEVEEAAAAEDDAAEPEPEPEPEPPSAEAEPDQEEAEASGDDEEEEAK